MTYFLHEIWVQQPIYGNELTTDPVCNCFAAWQYVSSVTKIIYHKYFKNSNESGTNLPVRFELTE